MEITKTKLSSVVEKLRELDLIFESGSDLDVAERGYSRKLINAISRRDDVFQCEAFKSLGDLYLHKTKMKKNKSVNFKKACAFYMEVSQHCASQEEKEVVQHRIKYAEKCTKQEYNPKYAETPQTESSENVVLTASMILFEVKEKGKAKGYGVIPLIEGYTDCFVKAVMDKQNCLQVESLKSLGDLYLEKGRVGDNDAEITKASGLYRAALHRCEDSDGRESLEHRIKYAEKMIERVQKKRQEKAKPVAIDKREEDPESKYQDHLQEGCRALQTGDLDMAEEEFAAALKTVHVTGEHSKESEPLLKLSDVYLNRGTQSKIGTDFTKAAALCNAALVRANREDIIEAIQEVTQSFVKYVLDVKLTVDVDDTEKHKLMLKDDRDFVEEEIKRIEEHVNPYSLDDDDPKLGEEEKKRAEAIKALFQTIVHQRRTFIADLVDECIGVMGSPPCKYAMVGLGSQATGLVTPYSDLEFAILIERETESNATYFRKLTHYLHLKVINLGETILPAMAIKSLNDFYSDDPLDNWFYDSVTPRGFSFDGAMPHACKTPLGRGKAFELIRTPNQMAKVLKDDLTLHLKKGYHLGSILGNVSLIKGDHNLVDEYTALWTQQLQENDGFILSSLARTVLSENAAMFELKEPTSSLLNVKKEIYRFSSIAVSCWAQLHNIQPTTIWDTIETLKENRVINSDNAHHLRVLVCISAELRLRTYMNNRGQVENMSALSSMSTETETEEKLMKVFYCSNAKQLMRYYYTALPLKYFISKLADSESSEQPSVLFNNSSALQAEVYRSLCDYETCKTFLEQTLEETLSICGTTKAHPDVATSLHNLGETWGDLGDHRKEISYYEQSLQMLLSIYGEEDAHTEIAYSLGKLGWAWSNLGDYRKALRYFEQALEMLTRIHGENRANLDISLYRSNLGNVLINLGDHQKAVKYFEQALQTMRSIYGANSANPDIARVLNSLGNAWRHLGDNRKAVNIFEQSLKMMRSIYGEATAHPGIVMSLNNLGIACRHLRDHKKAVKYFQQSLQINLSVYGQDTAHPDIASALGNLGLVWYELGVYRKALDYSKQSLQMMLSVYGESTAHPDIAFSLNILGAICHDLGEHRKAVSYYEQSLKMRRSIHGEGTAHCDIFQSLNSLGQVWRHLGNHSKAISYFEQAIQVRGTIYGEKSTNPYIADSLSNLGAAWSDLGDYSKSVSYYERALQIRRSIDGDNTPHPDIANLLNNLGTACQDLGENRKAVSYFEQALQMYQTIYGENNTHPGIAHSLNNLGEAWTDLGDYTKASSYLKASLQMRRSIYGENTPHPDIAKSLTNLGNVWKNLGDGSLGIIYYEQSLQMKRSIYGENTEHPDIAQLLSNLGNTWTDLGDYRKAASYLEASLQMRRNIYGENTPHPDIAVSLNSLGMVWRNLGDIRLALNYHEQSLQMKRSVFGENTPHPEIADSLNNLGVAWRDLGDNRKAVSYYEQALQMERTIYGENNAHPEIASVLNNLGDTWASLGDYRKAASYLEASLEMMRSIYGENTPHPNITVCLTNLGNIWSNLGDHKKAISYLEQSLQMMRTVYGDGVHPHIATTLTNLSKAWGKFGDLTKGLSYFRQAEQMKHILSAMSAAQSGSGTSVEYFGQQ